MKNTENEFPNNPIRDARLRKGLTQAGAAAALGYSPSYYSMMEREPRLISERMAARIERVLGVSPEQIGNTGATAAEGSTEGREPRL